MSEAEKRVRALVEGKPDHALIRAAHIREALDGIMDYDDEVDALAATLYNVKAQSPQEMTPERWARIKRLFPQSVAICRGEALEQMEDED